MFELKKIDMKSTMNIKKLVLNLLVVFFLIVNIKLTAQEKKPIL